MKRRHFLSMGALSLGAMGLPGFITTGFASEQTVLALPSSLKNNPLLQFDGLPNFADTKPAHIKPAIDYLVAYNKEVVQFVGGIDKPTWNNFYLPLERAQNLLERAWHIPSHLDSVKDSDALRLAYEKADEVVTDYGTWVGMYRPLYEGFVKLKNAPEYQRYTTAQKRAVDNALRDFELSGIALTGDKAARYAQIKSELSKLSTKFGNNVLDAVAGYELVVTDPEALSGLPQTAIDAAAESAKDKGKKGYRFTLDYPSYSAVMKYADDRTLRFKMYEAYNTRASDQGPNANRWDNTPIIEQILALRFELAQLLGYQNYAHYALATRMANSPSEVMGFLTTLLTYARPKGLAEMAELAALAKGDFEPWDISYIAEKQRLALYDIDEEAVREYFVVDQVLAGMFEVARRLFGVTISERDVKKDNIKVWHDDVRFFDVYLGGQLVASFYADLYARPNKSGGAWMNSAIDRRVDGGRVQLPVAHLVCNFAKATGDRPALLLHDDVTTLFHEFGHGLHHMLTRVGVMAVAGINGVAWDAVEFPSQLLENWTWDYEALSLISRHYKTGEVLPKALAERLIAAQNHHAARFMVRQLEYGLFDFRLNNEYTGDPRLLAELREHIKTHVSVMNEPEWTRNANAFRHIFSGGYAAGYYSYLWADVLASDAFTRFAREGIFNGKTGQAYLDAFLAQGGSKDPMTMFVDFMGRKPDPNALLRARQII